MAAGNIPKAGRGVQVAAARHTSSPVYLSLIPKVFPEEIRKHGDAIARSSKICNLSYAYHPKAK